MEPSTVLGTTISAFAIGLLTYGAGQASGGVVSLPFLECLVFGSLISATDPVTVLAIFNELGADPDLYALVFGESVLNDAVAIVLYRTVCSFLETPVSKRGVFSATWFFCVILIGSFSIGIIVSLLSALIFKYGGFQDCNLGVLEACILSLFPYVAYMMADAGRLSSIVAILFAGITMKHYTYPNLSKEAQSITSSYFSMLAKLAETFIFIYMGVAVFLETQSWSSYQFALCSIAITLLARVFNIYPLSYIVNLFREKHRRIPMNHRHALWFSGLRGALAFALALESVSDLPDGHGRILMTSTLIMVLFTVLFIGGATPIMLQVLKIKCGQEAEETETSPGGGPGGHPRLSITLGHDGRCKSAVEDMFDDEVDTFHKKLIERHKAKMRKRIKKLKADARKLRKDATFTSLDRKYLKPFFVGSQPLSGRHSDSEIPSNRDSPNVRSALLKGNPPETELSSIQFKKSVDEIHLTTQQEYTDRDALLAKYVVLTVGDESECTMAKETPMATTATPVLQSHSPGNAKLKHNEGPFSCS